MTADPRILASLQGSKQISRVKYQAQQNAGYTLVASTSQIVAQIITQRAFLILVNTHATSDAYVSLGASASLNQGFLLKAAAVNMFVCGLETFHPYDGEISVISSGTPVITVLEVNRMEGI